MTQCSRAGGLGTHWCCSVALWPCCGGRAAFVGPTPLFASVHCDHGQKRTGLDTVASGQLGHCGDRTGRVTDDDDGPLSSQLAVNSLASQCEWHRSWRTWGETGCDSSATVLHILALALGAICPIACHYNFLFLMCLNLICDHINCSV